MAVTQQGVHVFDSKQKTTFLTLFGVVCATFAIADENAGPKSTKELREPVYRVTKQDALTTKAAAAIVNPSTQVDLPKPKTPRHPLDQPLELASKALSKSQADYADYTAILVKRERVSGKLGDEQYMFTKIRNEKLDDNGNVRTPFSVYMKFLKPAGIKGREVIYVKGKNNGKLIAHEGGFKGRFTPSLYLDPRGTLAMMGQRYPITDIGIENLCKKLIDRGKRDKLRGDCIVRTQPAVINKRAATRVDVIHPEKKSYYDFHMARIYIDKEHEVPVRYEAYDWPRQKGASVSVDELIEEYTYVRLKFNVGLADKDFDPSNSSYNME